MTLTDPAWLDEHHPSGYEADGTRFLRCPTCEEWSPCRVRSAFALVDEAIAVVRGSVAWLDGNNLSHTNEDRFLASIPALRLHRLIDIVEAAVTRHKDTHPSRAQDCEMCDLRARLSWATLRDAPAEDMRWLHDDDESPCTHAIHESGYEPGHSGWICSEGREVYGGIDPDATP